MWLGHRQTVRCLPPLLASSALRLHSLRALPSTSAVPCSLVCSTTLLACLLAYVFPHCRACPALQVVLTDSGPMLKVDLAATTMLAPMSVLDFVAYKLGENPAELLPSPSPSPQPQH